MWSEKISRNQWNAPYVLVTPSARGKKNFTDNVHGSWNAGKQSSGLPAWCYFYPLHSGLKPENTFTIKNTAAIANQRIVSIGCVQKRHEKATCHYLIYLLDALKLRTSGFKPRRQWHCWLQVFLGCTRFKAKDSLKTLGEMKLLIVTAFDCFEATLNLLFRRFFSERACLCQTCAILNRGKSFSNFKRQSWFIFVSWFVPTPWRYSFFPSSHRTFPRHGNGRMNIIQNKNKKNVSPHIGVNLRLLVLAGYITCRSHGYFADYSWRVAFDFEKYHLQKHIASWHGRNFAVFAFMWYRWSTKMLKVAKPWNATVTWDARGMWGIPEHGPRRVDVQHEFLRWFDGLLSWHGRPSEQNPGIFESNSEFRPVFCTTFCAACLPKATPWRMKVLTGSHMWPETRTPLHFSKHTVKKSRFGVWLNNYSKVGDIV